jgi:dCTP deaminase
MPIGQLVLMRLTAPAERPYGSAGLSSKYQNQTGATPSAVTRG